MITTGVPGGAELMVDLRDRGCERAVEPVWAREPISFDERLVGLATEACRAAAGSERVLTSGALHDAAEVARVLPAAMVLTPSVAGLSHTVAEDTDEADLPPRSRRSGCSPNGRSPTSSP